MSTLAAQSVALRRVSTLLLAGFAMLALVLAAVGIYGVMAYSVARRTHEIGTRMALGAQPNDVLRLVLGQGARLTIAGVIIGVLAALALTRFMASILFGISASDPLTFAGVAILLSLHRAGRLLHPGAPGHAHRSNGGAEIRIAKSEHAARSAALVDQALWRPVRSWGRRYWYPDWRSSYG